MRPQSFLLVFLLLVLGACRPADLTFAAIPWGSDAEAVQRMMAERGFAFLSEANDRGDHLYAGTFAGHRAVVVARMAEGRLAKFEIGIEPPEGEEGSLFRSLEERLSAEFGSQPGTLVLERAAGGDAWLSTPEPLGPQRSVWSRTSRAGESYLILENRPHLAVVISFESPAWHWEYLRRQPSARGPTAAVSGRPER